jgi:hypothetical protein
MGKAMLPSKVPLKSDNASPTRIPGSMGPLSLLNRKIRYLFYKALNETKVLYSKGTPV